MLKGVFRGLIDLVYPKRCLGCKQKAARDLGQEILCPRCWSKIKRNNPPFCYFCGRQLTKDNLNKNLCPNCLKTRLHFDRAFSPLVYEGIAKELVHEFKYKGKDYLGKPLSRFLVNFISEYKLPIEHIDLIVPVPLHKTRLRQREYNQAEILSRYIADEFKKELRCDILERHKNTLTQTELETRQRYDNLKDSFRFNGNCSLKGKNLLLVDDVLTTGATCSEAAGTLKKSGAGIVFVLTLAN